MSLINFEKWGNHTYSSPDSIGVETNSVLSPYVPFYAGFLGIVLTNNRGSKAITYASYCVNANRNDLGPSSSRHTAVDKTYSKLIDTLSYREKPYWYKNGEIYYNGIKGGLCRVQNGLPNWLFLLAFPSKDFFTIGPTSTPEEIAQKAILFVKREFTVDPQYKLLYKKMMEMYFTPLQDIGIDLVITKDINKKCFVCLPAVQFATISERNLFLDSLNDKFVYA